MSHITLCDYTCIYVPGYLIWCGPHITRILIYRKSHSCHYIFTIAINRWIYKNTCGMVSGLWSLEKFSLSRISIWFCLFSIQQLMMMCSYDDAGLRRYGLHSVCMLYAKLTNCASNYILIKLSASVYAIPRFFRSINWLSALLYCSLRFLSFYMCTY